MNADQLEFAISQYLDGTLPAEAAAALQRLVAEDAEAGALLQEHRVLQTFLRTAMPLPDLQWEKLAASISSVVASTKVGMTDVAESADALIPEELEFAASQYLDGVLPLPERVAFEERLGSDALARRALEAQRTLGSLLKAGLPVPEMDWTHVSQNISAAVAKADIVPVEAVQPISEETELAISQYIDGTLTPGQQSALEARLASDSSARSVLAEYRSLDAVAKRALPMPVLRWDRLAKAISAAVATVRVEKQRGRFVLLDWLRLAMPLAAAACLLLAVGIVIKIYAPSGGANVRASTPLAMVEVDGPEKATGQAVAVVSFDAADWVNNSRLDYYASSGVVQMPSNIQLADSTPVTEDQTPLPPF